MSNFAAIAIVTSALVKAIDDGIKAVIDEYPLATPITVPVTSIPLDKARENRNDFQVNVYLYRMAIDAAWRNMDLPNQVKQGEQGFPPLPLNLHYLITAFAPGNDEAQAHFLLGAAMNVLHDTPFLPRDWLENAPLAASISSPNIKDVHQQIEQVKITPEALSLEEVSKIWAAFQSNYRLSASYEASLVLINSRRKRQAALPVMRRGKDDQGVLSLTKFPELEGVEMLLLPNGLRAQGVQPGDQITVRGTDLDATGLIARVSHSLWRDPLPTLQELTPVPNSTSPESLAVQIPNSPADWPPGYYSLGMILEQPGNAPSLLFASNEVPFPLLPTITAIHSNPPTPTTGTPVTITIGCAPQVWKEQRVSLLVGLQEIAFKATGSTPSKMSSIDFTFTPEQAGTFMLRLRVDGVDSAVLDPNAKPPQFDASKQITVM